METHKRSLLFSAGKGNVGYGVGTDPSETIGRRYQRFATSSDRIASGTDGLAGSIVDCSARNGSKPIGQWYTSAPDGWPADEETQSGARNSGIGQETAGFGRQRISKR